MFLFLRPLLREIDRGPKFKVLLYCNQNVKLLVFQVELYHKKLGETWLRAKSKMESTLERYQDAKNPEEKAS